MSSKLTPEHELAWRNHPTRCGDSILIETLTSRIIIQRVVIKPNPALAQKLSEHLRQLQSHREGAAS